MFLTQEDLLNIPMGTHTAMPCFSTLLKTSRKKGQQEYQLWIGGKKNVRDFLMKILPYSNRANEIAMYIKFLEERGRDIDKLSKSIGEI